MALNGAYHVLFGFESDWKSGILEILENDPFRLPENLEILENNRFCLPWNLEILENDPF